MKKSPPTAGRGRGSRKSKPTGVMPITKYFPRSPRSTPLVAEAAGSSPTSQPSPPLKELPKSPLSDTSNQSVNSYCESTVGEKTRMQPLKVSPKKIKLGDVRVVLRRSPIKTKSKVGTCSQAEAELLNRNPHTETVQSDVITISDSPAELSSFLSIDVELTAPEPKRPCLIDLTESPIVVVDMQRGSSAQAVCCESGVKGGTDNNDEMKEPVPATSSTAPDTNCTIKKALFTDCEMQSASSTLGDDLASTSSTSPTASSQKNDKVELDTIAQPCNHAGVPHTSQPVSPLVTEGETSEPINPPTTGKKTTQPFNLPIAGGGISQPVNPPSTRGGSTGEGGIQPRSLNPLEPPNLPVTLTDTSGCTPCPTLSDSSSAADSATVSDEVNSLS